MQRTFSGLWTAAIVAWLCCACGSVAEQAQPAAARGVAQALGGSFSSVDLVREATAAEATVEVRVTGAAYLTGVSVDVPYDPAVLTPIDVAAGPALGGLAEGTGAELLELSVLSDPGTVHCGQLLAGTDAGFSGDGVLLTVRFAQRPFAVRGASAAGFPPDRHKVELFQPYLTGELRWYCANPGDYDQNGEVNMADLAPLARHWQQQGPFPEGEARNVVDGDGNGLINLADVTVIGQYFGQRLLSYRLYSAYSLDDYPDAGGEGAELPLVQPDNSSVRLSFSYGLPAPDWGGQPFRYYWAVPQFVDGAGTASEPLYAAGLSELYVAASRAEHKTAESPNRFSLLATAYENPDWGAGIVYDWDLDSDGSWDITAGPAKVVHDFESFFVLTAVRARREADPANNLPGAVGTATIAPDNHWWFVVPVEGLGAAARWTNVSCDWDPAADDIRYAWGMGDTAQTTIRAALSTGVETIGDFPGYASVELALVGDLPAVVIWQDFEDTESVYYSQRDAGGWSEPELLISGTDLLVTRAVDDGGTVAVAVASYDDGSVQLLRRSGPGLWDSTSLSPDAFRYSDTLALLPADSGLLLFHGGTDVDMIGGYRIEGAQITDITQFIWEFGNLSDVELIGDTPVAVGVWWHFESALLDMRNYLRFVDGQWQPELSAGPLHPHYAGSGVLGAYNDYPYTVLRSPWISVDDGSAGQAIADFDRAWSFTPLTDHGATPRFMFLGAPEAGDAVGIWLGGFH